VVALQTTNHHPDEGKTTVFTNEMQREMLRQRTADLPRHRAEHLRLLRESGHPPSRRRIAPLRAVALILAVTAGRIDRETARRVIA
jgi:hypothetical protein